MYHLRIVLRLGQTVSGCGQIHLTTMVTSTSGALREFSSVAECQRECMPDGPGGGICWAVPHQEFVFDLESKEPLPHFRTDGTSEAGEYPLRVTSREGHLQQTELVAHTSYQPPRYSRAQAEQPTCVPKERREVCRYGNGSLCGDIPSGCPGTTISCGCDWGLSCQGGICMPPHQACDPIGPRDVCRSDVCGKKSAGCPGAFVECACPSGRTCRDGRCRE